MTTTQKVATKKSTKATKSKKEKSVVLKAVKIPGSAPFMASCLAAVATQHRELLSDDPDKKVIEMAFQRVRTEHPTEAKTDKKIETAALIGLKLSAERCHFCGKIHVGEGKLMLAAKPNWALIMDSLCTCLVRLSTGPRDYLHGWDTPAGLKYIREGVDNGTIAAQTPIYGNTCACGKSFDVTATVVAFLSKHLGDRQIRRMRQCKKCWEATRNASKARAAAIAARAPARPAMPAMPLTARPFAEPLKAVTPAKPTIKPPSAKRTKAQRPAAPTAPAPEAIDEESVLEAKKHKGNLEA